MGKDNHLRKFIEEYFKENKKRFIITVSALTIWIGLSVYLSGYNYDNYYNGTSKQCFICNRWPVNMPFYNVKYGIRGDEGEIITEPHFPDYLSFGTDGLAWDFEGHYVDREGNIVVTNKYYLENDRLPDNPMKFALYTYNKSVFGRFDLSEYASELTYIRSNYYEMFDGERPGTFSNGLSRYRTWILDEHKLYLKYYGYLDMNGDMVIEPQFVLAEDFDENGYAIVALHDEEWLSKYQYAIIDTHFGETHEYVLKPEGYKEIKRDDDGNYLITRYGGSRYNPDAIMDSEGNIEFLDGGSEDE